MTPILNPRPVIACTPDAAYVAHRDVAVQSTCGVFRNTALLDSTRPIGVLPDWVIAAMGIETTTRQTSMSVERERHAVNRRLIVSQKDADFVAQHCAEALQNIKRVKPHGGGPHSWKLICDVPSQNRPFALGLKFVPKAQARSGRDEFWVQTAHRLKRPRR
jgi:hypothetical protein